MCFRPPEAFGECTAIVCAECASENAPGETKCIFCGASLPVQGERPVAVPKAPPPIAASDVPKAPTAPKADSKQEA